MLGNSIRPTKSRAVRRLQSLGKSTGGAALEYILVTTFAAVTGAAALGFVSKIVKERLERLEEKFDENHFDEGPHDPLRP